MTVINVNDTALHSATRSPLWRRILSRIGRGVAAGLAAAVLLGVVARALMRLAVLATGGDPGFSWTGTLGICIGFAMFVLPGAVLAALYRGRGRSLLLVAGGVWLGYFTTVVARADLGSLEELSRGRQAGGLAAAAGILLTALAIPWVTLRLLRALGLGPRQRPV
jgi:hypothetical protein